MYTIFILPIEQILHSFLDKRNTAHPEKRWGWGERDRGRNPKRDGQYVLRFNAVTDLGEKLSLSPLVPSLMDL